MIVSTASDSQPSWRALRVPLEIWLAMVAAALTTGLLKYGWSPFDDGVYLWSARRLLDGAVLHGDLQVNHPGYSFYIDTWLFSAFGTHFSVLRYPLPFIAGLLTAIIAWCLRPAGRTMQCVGALGAASLGVVQFITPSSGWYAVALAALALATFLKALAVPSRASIGWLVTAGFLIGACAGFRQLNGAMLGAGLVMLHAWLSKPVPDSTAVPARWLQAISLVAILMATGVIAMPALAAPSLMAWVYSFPALWCATQAFVAWKRNMRARDPRWLLPVAAGCALGFLPAVIVPIAQGVLPGFVSDTVTDAFAFGAYSSLRDVNFNLAFVDAIELFSVGSFFAIFGGSYLLLVGLVPLTLSLMLCAHPRAMSDRTRVLVMLAAVCLPISITYQGLIYFSYWLPASMAALLALADERSAAARKPALIFVAVPATFALAFLSGRVPGSNIFKLLSEPGHRLVACELPRCDLRIDSQMRVEMKGRYDDILRSVPADRPLLILPDGASLYGSLQHPTPWSTSFLIPGLSSIKQVAKVESEFLGRPRAVLALDRAYLSSPARVAGLDVFLESLCLARDTSKYLYFAACPAQPLLEPPET